MIRNPLEDFAAYQRGKGLSEITIVNRFYTLQALERRTRKTVLEVTLHDLRDALGRTQPNGAPLSAGTKQTERNTYVAFFTFAKDEGFRKTNPAKRLAPVRKLRAEPRPYSHGQVDQLLTTGSYFRTRVMILLAAHQGLRAGSICRVHGTDFDLERNTMRVIGKGNRVGYLPLHPVTRALVVLMPTDAYWFPARSTNTSGHIRPRSVSELMRRAKERAGIVDQNLTGHSLRHHFGTELVAEGVDIRVVQELMMHQSIQSTQIYTGIRGDQKQDAILHLPGRDIPEHSGRRAA